MATLRSTGPGIIMSRMLALKLCHLDFEVNFGQYVKDEVITLVRALTLGSVVPLAAMILINLSPTPR